MQVLSVIHSLYALFGVSANLVLLVIILLTKSSGLKSYTVIISNVAVVDLIEIVIDAFEVPSAFGPELCYRCHLVMLHLIFHSLFLIAFSFWYRYVILVKTPPSWFTVQAAIVVLFIPNGVPMVLSFFAKDDREKSVQILSTLYHDGLERDNTQSCQPLRSLLCPH
ncbi:hypothetical protein PMAYCL1PPCAC_15042 [Pristionchus mayeri]|uniref:G protein-coupled receptor n=1 Tax=Pristionchus mayeri TaxID=1317129 RepID=A0AAN5HXH7_9BILA|nr:hypothetical protein PMAYCL1PPCAC_15042 [Pristionchus mayeri]